MSWFSVSWTSISIYNHVFQLRHGLLALICMGVYGKCMALIYMGVYGKKILNVFLFFRITSDGQDDDPSKELCIEGIGLLGGGFTLLIK